MPWAADGQDGNGLHLERTRLICSSLLLLSWKTRLVLYKYFTYDKGS